jgi:predicted lipoprotein with Yx(FWY)xxD motif
VKNNRFLTRFRLAACLLLAGLVAGCFPIIPQTGQQQPTPTTQGQGGTPSVTILNQDYDGTTVVVPDVVSVGPGWMAVHNQENGVVGPAIGYAPVKNGDNKNVKVTIDPNKATPVLYAMLHVDVGQVGKYEFPGPDAPVFVNGEMISPPFQANKQSSPQSLVNPQVKVQNQQVKDGKVVIQEVASNGPGWIVIHIQTPEGQPGNDIGYAPLKAGENSNVTVIVDPTQVTKVMYAMLHTDAGERNAYEFPGPDIPVAVDGVMVSPPFTSDGSPLAGQPTIAPVGEMTMMAPNQPPVAQAGSTGAPSPAETKVPPAPSPTEAMAMNTSPPGVTPLVKVSDQPLNNDMVKIDQVVSGGPGWVVVYTLNASGQPDQAIGFTQVKEGENRAVMVKVDPAKAKGTLFAQLHTDAGKVGTYEFPGPDQPVMLGVTMISSQFKIAEPQAQAAKPTAAPAATALVPSITVADQPIKDSSVVLPQVVAEGDTWVVIHRVNGDGTLGSAVGDTLVHNGVSTNVVVKLDTTRTSSTMFAMLHKDLGKPGVIEFPGADVPVEVNGQMIAPRFKVVYSAESDVILNAGVDGNNTPYLVDGRGMTLYLSLNDPRGKTNCVDKCLETWKPLLATGQVIVASGVSANQVGVILRPDGTRQITYAGAPVYYYVHDTNTGDTKGQGLDGSWFTVSP